MGNTKIVFRLILVAFVGLLSGCPGGGGGGDVELTNAPSTDNPVGISLTFSTMNGKTDSQIAALSPSITDNSGNVYYNSTGFSISGICSLGVGKVVATVNGATVGETADCDANSNFTWSKTFSSGTPETGTAYTVVLKPADNTGAVFQNLSDSQYITKSIVIDDNTPAASTGASATGGSSVNLVSGIWQINGTGASTTVTVSTTGPSDLFRVVVDNYPSIAVTYTAGATPISFSDTVVEGTQKTYNIVVYDRAGNASVAESVVVNYSSQITIVSGNVSFSSVPLLSSNVNGSDAVLLLGTAGPTERISNSTTGGSDWQILTDFIGFSTQNP